MVDYGDNILSIDVTTGAASILAAFDRDIDGTLGARMAVIPEPATLLFIGIGAVMMRRRK
jgi:hypothetical protein